VHKHKQFLGIQQVEYDVAVAASKEHGAEVKAGIEVVGVSLFGGKANTKLVAVSVSRLRFVVPILFPSRKGDPDD
jgi:hypothetical protein